MFIVVYIVVKNKKNKIYGFKLDNIMVLEDLKTKNNVHGYCIYIAITIVLVYPFILYIKAITVVFLMPYMLYLLKH